MDTHEATSRFGGLAALVTGGTSGIGRAIAAALAAEGAQVAVVGRDAARAAEAAEGIPSRGGAVIGLGADVAVQEQIAAAVNAVASRFGQLDLLVNCAGIPGRGSLAGLPAEEWRRVLAVNLDGAFFTCQAAYPYLARSSRAAIVNVGSIAGLIAYPSGAYGPSKAALVALTKQLALEWGAARIRVNVLSPGTTLTRLTEVGFPEEVRRLREARIPLGRLGMPGEMAAVALFLLSDEARYVTGQNVVVDGGLSHTLLAGPDARRH